MWRFLFLLLGFASAAGCSGRRSAAPLDLGSLGSDAPSLIPVRVGAKGLLFSFFDQRAELRTVERLEQVLASARGEVQVTDPAHPLEGDEVYLADLRQPDSWGRYHVWVDRRGAWLDRVMPRLSQLPRSPAAPAKVAKARKPAKKKRPRPRVAARGGQPRVIIFSTSWCPSCKAARAHLQSRGVPFVEADVEKDQQAAAYYQKLIETHGLKQGAVPLIVVDGKPMQGFSAPQLDAVLAAAGIGAQGRR